MTKVIRIDGDDYEALKEWAEPFKDSPGDVVGKLVLHAIRTKFTIYNQGSGMAQAYEG